jgi:hypothetical protein
MWARPSAVDQQSGNAVHRLFPAQGCDRFTLHRKSPLVAAGPSVTASEPSMTGELIPGAVGTMPELQQAGFHYSK